MEINNRPNLVFGVYSYPLMSIPRELNVGSIKW
jgi:hypothetical protein